MRVLVACEESQRVCAAFRSKGHEAYSCDIIPTSGLHPEWHIQADVLPLLNGFCVFHTCDGTKHYINSKWDMIIAFPPCFHLAVSGAPSFAKKREDGRQEEAIKFFCAFLNADCDKIVIENPVGIISGDYVKKWFPDLCQQYELPRKPTQIIHPWMFGENVSKRTCLWIKGVKPLAPDIAEQPNLDYKEWTDNKTGRERRCDQWHYDTYCLPKKIRAKERSKTFEGIAQAMAAQWG